jgi:DnaJ-domain-containing protein 1
VTGPAGLFSFAREKRTLVHPTVGHAADAPAEPSAFAALFRAGEQRQNVCVLAVLTWLASCDGSIAPGELELLRSVAAGVAGGDVLPAVIDAVRPGHAEDLELASRYLRNHLDRAGKLLLARLLITMAAQDGYLTVAENHVLRYLSDLLGLSARRFAKLFLEVTHRPFPEPGDPGDPEWWRRREAGEEAHAPADGWGDTGGGAARTSAGGADAGAGPDGTLDGGRITRAAALRMFGLDNGATPDVIHSAYRRLAKARHPDRFARLGPAAQATATIAFQRIQQAYEILSASAPAGAAR